MTKLTVTMRNVLVDIAEGRGTHYGVEGRSAHGGRARVLLALRRQELITHPFNNVQLTEAGRAVLQQESTYTPTNAEYAVLGELHQHKALMAGYQGRRRILFRLRYFKLVTCKAGIWRMTEAGKRLYAKHTGETTDESV